MRSKLRTVDSLCAITIEVRPFINRSIACWISPSDSESRLEVASSRINTGASARTRQRDPLPLTARQLYTALSDQRAIPFRQPQDEVMRIGEPRRLLDRGHVGLGPAVGDVLSQRAGETESAPAAQPLSGYAAIAVSLWQYLGRRSGSCRRRGHRAAAPT